MNLIACYVVRADGTGTAAYFFDGQEISAAEYLAITIAALDRALSPEVEG
jgi:hypothetical protein